MARRRYKLGKNLPYDKMYGGLKSTSPILNPGRFVINEVAMQMSSKGGLEALLAQLRGDEDGRYFDPAYGGSSQIAKIPRAEGAIPEVKDDFAALKQRAMNEGRRPPKNVSAEMEAALLEAEAKLDVTMEEADKIERLLAEVESKEQIIDDSRVLKGGPKGVGRLIGGILVEVDGQVVTPDGNGVLAIHDSRSPYDGLPTEVYYDEIVKPWRLAMAKLNNERYELARSEKRPVGEIPQKREPLPPWPKSVPKVKMVRTKK
ncbi:MAG: hypothetical protein IH975_05380 [Nitrospinae bacterium]|nr:hypothetical protein [Nitrospinota bacterium]